MPKKPKGKASKRPTERRPAASAPPGGDILNFSAAVDFLHTTKPTLYRWIGEGRIKGHKAGRQWRFYRHDLRKFLEYSDPKAAVIDLSAVRAAIRLLDERIAKATAKQARPKGEPS